MNNLVGFFLTFVAGASVGISMWPLKWVRGLKSLRVGLLVAAVLAIGTSKYLEGQ